MGFCVFVCMILLEPLGLDSRNVAQTWPLIPCRSLSFCFRDKTQKLVSDFWWHLGSRDQRFGAWKRLQFFKLHALYKSTFACLLYLLLVSYKIWDTVSVWLKEESVESRNVFFEPRVHIQSDRQRHMETYTGIRTQTPRHTSRDIVTHRQTDTCRETDNKTQTI